MKYLLISMGVLGLLGSCSQTQESSQSDQIRLSFKQDLAPPYLNIESTDSIRIGYDSEYFFDRVPEINPDLFKTNKQFVLSRPNVIIGQIDTTGHFVKKITQKGTGPGQLFIARSAKAWAGSNGDNYVLTNANAFALNVYSETGQFKYTARLFNAINDVYHPKSGFYHMSEKTNGVYTLTLSIGSTKHSPFDAKYYENSNTIAQYVIDDNSGEIIDSSTKLLLKEYPEVQNALSEKRISWGSRDAIFKKYNNLFYLTFPFSKTVYVYNEDFEKLEEISLKTLHLYDKGFNFQMQPSPENLFDRTYLEHRAYLENTEIHNLQILDNILIIQYLAPLKESQYISNFPTKKSIQTQDNWQDFFIKRDQIWLIYDLKTGKEKLIRLSNEHDKGVFLDKNRLLVTRNLEGIEDTYIFKYKLKESIDDF